VVANFELPRRDLRRSGLGVSGDVKFMAKKTDSRRRKRREEGDNGTQKKKMACVLC
jgi:hypothetical protein